MNSTHVAANQSDGPFSKLVLITICALALMGGIAQQQTARANESRTAKVSLAGLDLTTAQGMRAARARLHEAARVLCMQVEDPEDLSHQENFVACVEQSMTAALQQIPGPALAGLSTTHSP